MISTKRVLRWAQLTERCVAAAAAGAADAVAVAVVDHLGYPSSKTCKELKKTFFKEANAKREFYSKEIF